MVSVLILKRPNEHTNMAGKNHQPIKDRHVFIFLNPKPYDCSSSSEDRKGDRSAGRSRSWLKRFHSFLFLGFLRKLLLFWWILHEAMAKELNLSNAGFSSGGSGVNLSMAMERLGLRSLLSQNSPISFHSQVQAQAQAQSQEDEQQTGEMDRLRQEEAALEEMIVDLILGGKWDFLQPNTGNAVTIGNHHVCVSYGEEAGLGYRTWEWHGHIMVYDEEEGCTPEYVYGNYFEELEDHHGGYLKPSLPFSFRGISV